MGPEDGVVSGVDTSSLPSAVLVVVMEDVTVETNGWDDVVVSDIAAASLFTAPFVVAVEEVTVETNGRDGFVVPDIAGESLVSATLVVDVLDAELMEEVDLLSDVDVCGVNDLSDIDTFVEIDGFAGVVVSVDVQNSMWQNYTFLTLSTLGKIFSRRQTEIYFILSQKTGFDISCDVSLMEIICMKCQNLFSGKNKTKISLTSRLLN